MGIQDHAALAEDLIDETYEEQGIYGVSFWRHGRWQMTWVDFYFPCYMPSSRNRGKHKLIFAGANDGKEIWMPVVEKAFAKVAGSYEAISGGVSTMALEMLTGGRAKRYQPKELPLKWDKFTEGVASDEYFVCAGSLQLEENEEKIGDQKKVLKGIVTGHAYTILNTYHDDDTRFLELRNPWGRVKYYGDWGRPGCRKWITEQGRKAKSIIGSPRTEEGRFWMSMEDFILCFDSVDICYLNFTEEDRVRRAELQKEADRIIPKEDRPKRQSSDGKGGDQEGQPGYTRESADAMMELLIAEEEEEKRKASKNKKKGGKGRGKN